MKALRILSQIGLYLVSLNALAWITLLIAARGGKGEAVGEALILVSCGLSWLVALFLAVLCILVLVQTSKRK